jgi:hypothetical protein
MAANMRIVKNMIREAVIASIRTQTKKAYSGTQAYVPVDKGILKASGQEQEIHDGAKIGYNARYASYVERGVSARDVNVRGYYHPNGYYVQPFTRWQPKRKPKYFIKRPIEEAMTSLPDTFDAELRGHFSNVIRR